MKQIKQEIQSIENRNNQMHTDKEKQINQRIETFNQQFIDFVNQHNLDLDGINTSIKQHNTEIEQNRIHINESFTNQQNEFQELKSKLEKEIQNQNQERLESILQGKERLQECVETLDEMEKNHSTEMDKYKIKLEES